MAKRQNPRKRKPRPGPKGPRGKTGPRGPRGPASANHVEVVKLSAQMNEVLHELQVQLTRIAQMQAQLDRLAAGQSPMRLDRRATDRTRH